MMNPEVLCGLGVLSFSTASGAPIRVNSRSSGIRTSLVKGRSLWRWFSVAEHIFPIGNQRWRFCGASCRKRSFSARAAVLGSAP